MWNGAKACGKLFMRHIIAGQCCVLLRIKAVCKISSHFGPRHEESLFLHHLVLINSSSFYCWIPSRQHLFLPKLNHFMYTVVYTMYCKFRPVFVEIIHDWCGTSNNWRFNVQLQVRRRENVWNVWNLKTNQVWYVMLPFWKINGSFLLISMTKKQKMPLQIN
jgi:hypothetical protein